MAKLTESDSAALEALIDRTSLRRVLEEIAQICRLKGHHIDANWQDAHLARRWYSAAGVIERAEANEKVNKVSQ